MRSMECAIVIPVFNGERFVGTAVDSALRQTATIPILVVDDGSTDATRRVLDERADAITVLRQDNCGTSAAWNRALRACTATWLIGLDSDDELEPRAVETLLMHARRAPDADIVYSDYAFIDETGEVVRCVSNPPPDNPVRQLLRLHDRLGQSDNFVPFGHARMYRRSALLAAGGYDESYRDAEDYELLLRLASAGATFHHVPEQLYRYRWHTTNKGVARRPQQVAEVIRAVRAAGLR
jgi:glycosyltransferase involved in cell wall biosynthesis